MAGYRNRFLGRALYDVLNEVERGGLRSLLSRPASLVMGGMISAPLWLAFFVLSLEDTACPLGGALPFNY